ncbi:MAG: hypothetical protein K0B05_10065 [Bacteroidales bacterium]|nr:hypothetical protein [Bacteroidales bacterium]
MKTIVAMSLLFFLFLASCEKEYQVPPNEIPGWLKLIIDQDEQFYKDNPKSMVAYGCWVRYSWQNDYYFEYHNVLSSSSPRAISYDRDTLKIWANDINTVYCKEKCCRAYVWKGPKFKDYFEN